MPKNKTTKTKPKHDPLHMDILEDIEVDTKPKRNKSKINNPLKKAKQKIVNARTSQKILEMAKQQSKENDTNISYIKSENEDDDDDDNDGEMVIVGENTAQRSTHKSNNDNSMDENNEFDYGDELDALSEHPEDVEVEEIDENDAALLDMFLKRKPSDQENTKTINLSEMILQKIQEKEAMEGSGTTTKNVDDITSRLNPKVVASFKKIGGLLKVYRGGQLPKAFKVLPKLSNWEELIFLTNPDGWTPQAVYQATRIFAAHLNNKMAQRFYNMILLPHVRNQVRSQKKVTYHIYQSLKKACYKPDGFYKGIVLPLLQSDSCTVKEVEVIASVIKKASIPILHSSAALLKLATGNYEGTHTIVIKAILDKMYALPTKVVEAMVDHFYSFVNESRNLPVIWHQSLLSFAKTYKSDLTPEHKKKLFAACKKHSHSQITPEIRRELMTSGRTPNPIKSNMQIDE